MFTPSSSTVDQNTSISIIGSSLSFVYISCHRFVFDLHFFTISLLNMFSFSPINPRGGVDPDWPLVILQSQYIYYPALPGPHWSDGQPLHDLSLVKVSCSFNFTIFFINFPHSPREDNCCVDNHLIFFSTLS